MMRDPDSSKQPVDKRFDRFFVFPRLAATGSASPQLHGGVLAVAASTPFPPPESINYTQLRVLFHGGRAFMLTRTGCCSYFLAVLPCPVLSFPFLLCARKQRPVPERERARRRSELPESVGQAARSSPPPGERRGRPRAHHIRAVHAGGRAAGRDETAPALEAFARAAREVSVVVGWLRFREDADFL